MRRGRGEMEQGEKRQREREARRDTSSGLGPHGGDVSLAWWWLRMSGDRMSGFPALGQLSVVLSVTKGGWMDGWMDE